MKDLTINLTDDELALVDRLASERRGSRDEAIREAIRRGARDELHRIALDRYREREVGLRGAADIAGTSIVELMREANARNVVKNDDETRLAEDVETLR